MQGNYTTVSACAAVAQCEDGTTRPVIAYHLGPKRVLVSRWPSLLNGHVLAALYPSAHLLNFLLSIADFEVINGLWTARVSATCIALACAIGQSRNTVNRYIKELARERFLDYQPARGLISAGLIQIPAVNRRSGFVVFDASPDWRASYVRAVDSKFRLADIPIVDRRAADSISPEQFGGLWSILPTTVSSRDALPDAGVLHLASDSHK